MGQSVSGSLNARRQRRTPNASTEKGDWSEPAAVRGLIAATAFTHAIMEALYRSIAVINKAHGAGRYRAEVIIWYLPAGQLPSDQYACAGLLPRNADIHQPSKNGPSAARNRNRAESGTTTSPSAMSAEQHYLLASVRRRSDDTTMTFLMPVMSEVRFVIGNTCIPETLRHINVKNAEYGRNRPATGAGRWSTMDEITAILRTRIMMRALLVVWLHFRPMGSTARLTKPLQYPINAALM